MLTLGDLSYRGFQEKAIIEILDYYDKAISNNQTPIINMFLASGLGKSSIVAYVVNQIRERNNGRIIIIEESKSAIASSFEIYKKNKIKPPMIVSIHKVLNSSFDFMAEDFIVCFSSNTRNRLKLARIICNKTKGILSVDNSVISGFSDELGPVIISMPQNDFIFDYRDVAAAPLEFQKDLATILINARKNIIEKIEEDTKYINIPNNHSLLKLDKKELLKTITENRKKIIDFEGGDNDRVFF